MIIKHPKITALLTDEDKLGNLLRIRMEEEKERLDGIPDVRPSEFTFFTQTANNKAVRTAYTAMQNQYVLRACDRIDFQTANTALAQIQRGLLNNSAWVEADNK